ncbi:MAG: hypothetical protein HRT45_17430, partial [Bdellovibrionales bacterium]|nr:hypothetical protein [Bdellovibrionales bacterium]
NLTCGVVGSVCEPNYQGQIDHIGDLVIESFDTVPLECAPNSGSLTLQVLDNSGNPDTSTIVTLDGNKLRFSPALTSGARVTGTYQCTEFINSN